MAESQSKRTDITMSEVIAKLDPSKSEPFMDIGDMENDLQSATYMGYSEEAGERVKRIVINEWLDSDTMVGMYAYYFDDNFAAISFQSGRKTPVEFKWESIEIARDVLMLFRELDDDLEVDVIEPDDTVKAHWFEVHERPKPYYPK